MYIKSVVLEGFKSYGKRTEINGFDPRFTAITGLNGTGKSNILDAICFVLGISNLSHVRAVNLQDLIYKNGQAGINKATVSITFDNTNPAQSPIGFNDQREIIISRQIALGGKNKYMINGTTVPYKKIHDLFCSIQLNINNPNFLIMQGKITKILSMKPLEFLSMIEETTGTSIYEDKKHLACKTMANKEAKISEIEDVFEEELSQRLNKLKEERAKYLEFLQMDREIIHMLGLYNAWEYIQIKKKCKIIGKKLEEEKLRKRTIDEKIEKNQANIMNIEREIEEFKKNSKKEINLNLEQYNSSLKDNEKNLAQLMAKHNSLLNEIHIEEQNRQQCMNELANDAKLLEDKKNKLDKFLETFESLRARQIEDGKNYEIAQKRYNAVSIGMEVNDEGVAESLQEQMINAKKSVAHYETEIKNKQIQLNQMRANAEKKQAQVATSSGDFRKNQQLWKQADEEVRKLENHLKPMNLNEDSRVQDEQRYKQLRDYIDQNQRQIENFEFQNSYIKLDYTPPNANFDVRKLHGVICQLIKVIDPQKYSVALEVAAGGNLYNVAVADEKTAKLLLDYGQLKRRVTFLPLNKMKYSQHLNGQRIKLAQSLYGVERVRPALELIEYDPQISPVIKYIFGDILVCDTLEIARCLTFDNRIKVKCVTLDGDVTNPAGTLSGGSRSKCDPILMQLAKIHELRDKLKNHETEMMELIKRKKKWSLYDEEHQKLAIKKSEAEMLRLQLESTDYYRNSEELKTIQMKIDEFESAIEEYKIELKKSREKVAIIAEKCKKCTSREDMVAEAESEMQNAKIRAEQSKNEWSKNEEEYQNLNMDVDELQKTLANGEEELKKLDENLVKLKSNVDELQVEIDKLKDIAKDLQNKINEENRVQLEKNRTIQDKMELKEKLSEEINEYKLELQKLSYSLKSAQTDQDRAHGKRDDFEERCKEFENYMKDAEALNQDEAVDLENRIRTAQETRNKLGRIVNADAQVMYDMCLQEYNKLVEDKSDVMNDRNKITDVMETLDERKKHILELAYQQVSKDFDSIFSTLLPGSNARLAPLAGRTIFDGVQVQVALGGIWKENLSELSGGQRSLAALSFLLALLLYKPAPLYILDEVDAALDMSHTQNIGQMLRNHFKKSQFIVVSLKDGMFSNANVLFRTRFIDGVSGIERTVNKKP